MVSTFLITALVVFSPRPGDRGTLTLSLPILPGGESAEALVVCSTRQLVGWWLPSGQWYEPRPPRFAHEYGWQSREKVRKACDQLFPRY